MFWHSSKQLWLIATVCGGAEADEATPYHGASRSRGSQSSTKRMVCWVETVNGDSCHYCTTVSLFLYSKFEANNLEPHIYNTVIF